MKLLPLLLLLVVSRAGLAQLTVTHVPKKSLPTAISYKGHLTDAVLWTDSLGEHLVIETETGETPSKQTVMNDARDAQVFAHHFIKQGTTWTQQWRVYDFVKDCPVEVEATFLKNTLFITDLDKDGTAEIWLMYRTVCRGDMSPSTLKIILYEGAKKHAMRGTSRFKNTSFSFDGGEYAFDDAFKKAPAVFRNYAVHLWKKNMTE